MADTYTQIYIHLVFAVQGRRSLLIEDAQPEIFKYISGTITGLGHKSIIVNGMEDHIHIFTGMKPHQAISDLVRDIKKSSNKFINEKGFVQQKFNWQNGFGAFSYSKSHIDRVYNYILNQKEHHKKKDFRLEYLELLEEFEVEYDERYLFDFNFDE